MTNSSNSDGDDFPEVDHLPKPLQKDFERLSYRVTRVHGRWSRFLDLFGESERRIELLNNTAPTFFKDFQETYIETIFLSIMRLLDHLTTMGAENLVLEQLLERVREVGDHDLADDLSNQLDKLKDHCDDLETWRHKRIAHLDRDIEHKKIADKDPIPEIQQETIEEALSLIEDFMNTVEGYYGDSQIHFEPITKGDAEALVTSLKKATDYDDAVEEGALSYMRLHQSRFSNA